MKLSCKVIEDMLPMYYDSVCSAESAELVEQHLKGCPQCNRILADLQAGITVEGQSVDDLKPLKSIQNKWKKSMRTSIRKGICITLITLLLFFTALTSVWYFSYAKYYYKLTKTMERTANEDKYTTSSDYITNANGYRFEVYLPVILSNSGFIRVMDDNGLVVFLHLEKGGNYSFWLHITDQDNRSYSVHLNANMTPDFENYPFPVYSEYEKQQITQLLTKKNEYIISMLNTIKTLWGIDLLKYVS